MFDYKNWKVCLNCCIMSKIHSYWLDYSCSNEYDFILDHEWFLNKQHHKIAQGEFSSSRVIFPLNMNKIIYIISLLFCFSFFNLIAKEAPVDMARNLLKNNINKYSCLLTDQEAEDVASQLFRLEGMSVNSFSATVECMETLIKGLRAVVEQHQAPDTVYKSMRMERYNITLNNWKYYINKYTSSEAIAKLEKWVPNNEQIIVKSLAKSFKPIIERWLFEQVILAEFSYQNPNLLISDDQKIRVWWNHELKKHIEISDVDKAILLGILSRRAIMPRKQVPFWKQYFKNKIRDNSQLSHK